MSTYQITSGAHTCLTTIGPTMREEMVFDTYALYHTHTQNKQF